MCTILKFAPATETGAQRESCGRRQKAEIVLFPGVCYERAANDEASELRISKLRRDYLIL
ncbi:MAG: hypothetical protein CMB79_24090 [Filomicrobium sp.]|nr:hypothetical protein [Filomicrobium sp.]